MKSLIKLGIGIFATALVFATGNSALAETYVVDASHSQVGFAVKHLVVSTVKGKFSVFEGSVEIDDQKNVSNVKAKIDVASVDTGRAKRDQHLRSPDFFDAATYPTIEFASTSISKRGDKYTVIGDLTIRGVTRKVTLIGELTGVINDPYFGQRAGFVATGKINRRNFDVKWSKQMDNGGLVVGDDVTLSIEVEALVPKQS